MRPLHGCTFFLCVGLMLAASIPAGALPMLTTVDLRTSGSSGTANGAQFTQDTTQPTGTGVYNPFVRVQDRGVEEAFNTDYRSNGQAPLDAKSDPNFTRSVTMGSLQTVTVGGVDYYAFRLDIDEPNSGPKRYLSLDEVKLYVADSPDLSTLDTATLKWDMDGAGDATVYLNGGNLSSGNGADDMQMLVPTSFFAGVDSDAYLYFYSKFGATDGMGADNFDANASFEEWSSLTSAGGGPPGEIPEPMTMILLGGGMAGILGFRRRILK